MPSGSNDALVMRGVLPHELRSLTIPCGKWADINSVRGLGFWTRTFQIDSERIREFKNVCRSPTCLCHLLDGVHCVSVEDENKEPF